MPLEPWLVDTTHFPSSPNYPLPPCQLKLENKWSKKKSMWAKTTTQRTAAPVWPSTCHHSEHLPLSVALTRQGPWCHDRASIMKEGGHLHQGWTRNSKHTERSQAPSIQTQLMESWSSRTRSGREERMIVSISSSLICKPYVSTSNRWLYRSWTSEESSRNFRIFHNLRLLFSRTTLSVRLRTSPA